MNRRRTLSQVFAWPIALAVATLLGLIGALLNDGSIDMLYCALLAVPIAIAFCKWRVS